MERIHTIWESLEQSWEEFEGLKNESAAMPFRETDESMRFADGWVSRDTLDKLHIYLTQAENPSL